MIIDWTYGAIAQLQGYFTTSIAINNSSVAPADIIVAGCLTATLDSNQPSAAFDSSQPSAAFDSKQPFIIFRGRCVNVN